MNKRSYNDDMQCGVEDHSRRTIVDDLADLANLAELALL